MDTDWDLSGSAFIESVTPVCQFTDNDFYNVFIQSLNDTLDSPRFKLENVKPIMYWTNVECSYLMELVRITPDIVNQLPKYKVASNPSATESFYETLKQVAEKSRELLQRKLEDFPPPDENNNETYSLPWQAPASWECPGGKWTSSIEPNVDPFAQRASNQPSANSKSSSPNRPSAHNYNPQSGHGCNLHSTCLPGFATALFLMNYSKSNQSDQGQCRSGQSSGLTSKQVSPRDPTPISDRSDYNVVEPPIRDEFTANLKYQHDFFLSPPNRESKGISKHVQRGPLFDHNMYGRHGGLVAHGRTFAGTPIENTSQLMMPCISRKNSNMLIKNSNVMVSASEDYNRNATWTSTERCGQGRYWPRMYSNSEEYSRSETSIRKANNNCGTSYYRANKPLAASRHTYCYRENESGYSTENSGKEEYICVFCKGNKEPETIYKSHPLRINSIVICPSLRNYTCFICKATGDNAHTIKYCPFNKRGFFATRSHEKCNSKNHSRTKMKVQVVDELGHDLGEARRSNCSQFIRDAKRNIDFVLRGDRLTGDCMGSETDEEKWDSEETDVGSDIGM